MVDRYLQRLGNDHRDRAQSRVVQPNVSDRPLSPFAASGGALQWISAGLQNRKTLVFQHVAVNGKKATQKCPYGRVGGPLEGQYSCSPKDIERYAARLSGPLVDRIDMHVAVGAVPLDALTIAEVGETSATIRARVAQARKHHAERVAIDGALASRGHSMLHAGLDRDARTIAALEGASLITAAHVAEALRYRVAPADGP